VDSQNTHPVVHLELHTGDREGASAFYAALCGWRPRPVDTGAGTYWSVGLSEGVGGGMVEAPTPRSLWLPYVEVEDVRGVTQRARAMGARVPVEPREGPVGWRSVVATPAGAELALWQPKR
jgi:predicted enzyme related to lactoylglutathione lyase